MSPSRSLRRRERLDRLQAALDALSPDHRQVIVLARLKGLRMTEIAERMERSPNAVALLLARALAKLRESFGDTESLPLGAPADPLGCAGCEDAAELTFHLFRCLRSSIGRAAYKCFQRRATRPEQSVRRSRRGSHRHSGTRGL